jgi:thiamine-monophosphate kinase
MKETQVVARIRKFAESTSRQQSIIKGIGDDCAVVRPRVGEDLVFTTDFLLEDRHFTLATHSPADLGHKALARSLSDLAAMGAEPVFCLVSLGVPAKLIGSWVTGFYRGLMTLARRFNITLAGGDLSRFDKVITDVMCCGRVPRGKALLRSGAKAGHRIYVTGRLGASAHGFAAKQGAAWRHHLRPEPRVGAGLVLRTLGVSAAIDLSDGLSLDLHRLCLESKVGAEIDSRLPIARGATVDEALNGGEDYELLFTAPASIRIPRTIGKLPVTPIGVITKTDRPGTVLFQGKRLRPGGFDHFA